MVYFTIIYLIIYSVVCYLVTKNIFKTKVDEIYNTVQTELETLSHNITSNFNETKKDIVKQNKQYLSGMNEDISKKILDLSEHVKNKKII